MRTFFRRSSSLARRASSVEASTYAFTRPRRLPATYQPAFARQSIRRYASVNPEPPKDPKENKDVKKDEQKGEEEAKSPVEEGGKESSQVKSEAKKEGDGLAPGYSKLNAEEEKHLDELFERLLKNMPEGQQNEMKKALQAIKAEGIPQELRDIMNKIREEGPRALDLGTVAKLIRLTTGFARKAADRAVSQENNASDIEKNESKAKTSESGEQKSEQQKTEKDGEKKDWRSQMELTLDLNTFLLSAFLAYMTYRLIVPGENSREITWQEFRNTFLDKGLVEKLVIVNQARAKVYLHRESVASLYPDSPAAHSNFYYYFTLGSVEAFERRLDEAQRELGIPSSERIPVAYNDEIPWMAHFMSFGPTILFIGVIVWLSRRAASGGGGQSGIFGMGRSRAKRFNHETAVKVKFADVAGMDEAKQEIMEFVSFLKEPGVYQKLGAKIPRGAILSGPPGTGKTLLAKATAGESGVPFYSVSGSEFVEMFVGVGPSRVRDLFATARKNAPCIIFIDEIDAIGKSRSKQNFGGGNDERESTLNQILTEMDGFNTSEQVVVVAGTNRPDILDKALMRPGRFDRHIAIDKPTMEGRKQIFGVHLQKIVTKEDMDHLQGRLAALTPGFSGADIANCVNEAALVAARHHAESVTMSHFEQAIERVIGGLEKKSLVLSPEEKKTVAYHEAGHAICGWYFKYADPLLKVSIIPRGQGALGYAQYLPAGDTYLLNVNQLMDRMAMTLGGRVSEELHFDTVTSGASDDFQKVTRLATAMVTRFGMSRKIGFLSFEDDNQQQLHKPFSEETAKNIDAEVRRIVDEAYKQCKDLLTEKKDQVGIVAEELLRKEVLSRDDMVRLLGPRPFEEKGEFAKYFGGGPRDMEGGDAGPSKAPPSIPSIEGDKPTGPPAPGQAGGEEAAPTIYRRTFEKDNIRWP